MARRDTAARRYAEAAFEIASADRSIDDWERDLERLQEVLADPELRALVEHPAVAYADKERVLRRVAGDVKPGAANLVLLMVRRGRPRAIAAMVEHFRALVRRQRGVALAEIRTALPLEDAQRDEVKDRLHQLTGDDIEITEVVDESLIGGITVRIGDQLYDASVRNRLERLRARLTAV
ncbi:MAG TPA: ATP synthase F1 subunit delta [Candidatus Limnocylindria bacterium]|nr:ATP synthase F1 subunit delta [Candidatus Limnocylindria bacterium]